jgi:hypothetical protein
LAELQRLHLDPDVVPRRHVEEARAYPADLVYLPQLVLVVPVESS